MLLEFVKKIWKDHNCEDHRLIMCDWLNDNKRDHKEIDHYINKFRNTSNRRILLKDIIDLILKLGNKKERKIMSKFRRRIKKYFKIKPARFDYFSTIMDMPIEHNKLDFRVIQHWNSIILRSGTNP